MKLLDIINEIGPEEAGNAMDGGSSSVSWRLGDNKSSLVDQFERRSFEVQLNQAILRRCLTEPHGSQLSTPALHPSPPSSEKVDRPNRSATRLPSALRKVMAPICGGMGAVRSTRRSTEVQVPAARMRLVDLFALDLQMS